MTAVEVSRSNTIHRRRTTMIWFIYLIIESIPVESDNGLTMEYCTAETFHAICSDGEVILMQEALYGRMAVGRCVDTSFDGVGCQVDVLEIVDGRCSGRHQCEVQVPDKEIHSLGTCSRQLTMYMSAFFTCLPVNENIPSKCSSSIPMTLTEESGYIVHSHSSIDECFWIIRLPAGLKINVTLFDFGVSRHKKGSGPRSLECYMYAYIKEASPMRTKICSGLERERIVYLSETNSIEVETHTIIPEKIGGGGEKSGLGGTGGGGVKNVDEDSFSTSSDSDGIRYLLKYEAVGCPDMAITPGHMIVHRPERDRLSVSCDNRTRPVQLICKDRQWVGTLPVCSQHSSHNESSPGFWSKITSDWVHAILVTVAIGMTLGIVIGVALLIVLMAYIKRKERHKMLSDHQTVSPHPHHIHHQQHQTQQQYYSRSIRATRDDHDQLQIYYERSRSAIDAESKMATTPGEFMQDSWLLMGQADDVICSCPTSGKLLSSPGNRMTERQQVVESQFSQGRKVQQQQQQQIATEHVYEMTC